MELPLLTRAWRTMDSMSKDVETPALKIAEDTQRRLFESKRLEDHAVEHRLRAFRLGPNSLLDWVEQAF
jgi:hypothetical protein